MVALGKQRKENSLAIAPKEVLSHRKIPQINIFIGNIAYNSEMFNGENGEKRNDLIFSN
ncbi:hypothetical protein Lepto7376_2790 [[Leptolyngbya] sp. PCC 7376]|nr:hypothetical protein Lepto7376_2790 [[Leptolyngbya] sp. PCC 7376]